MRLLPVVLAFSWGLGGSFACCPKIKALSISDTAVSPNSHFHVDISVDGKHHCKNHHDTFTLAILLAIGIRFRGVQGAHRSIGLEGDPPSNIFVTLHCHRASELQVELSTEFCVETGDLTIDFTAYTDKCLDNAQAQVPIVRDTPIEPHKRPCLLVGCAKCGGENNTVCLECDGTTWELVDSQCVCAADTGTFVEASGAGRSWPRTAPSEAECSQKQINPVADNRTTTCTLLPDDAGNGSTSNALVIDGLLVDAAACVCRPCPTDWTSLGGPPHLAVCMPTQQLGRRFTSLGVDITLLLPVSIDTEDAVVIEYFAEAFTALGDELGSTPLRPLGFLEPLGDVVLEELQLVSRRDRVASNLADDIRTSVYSAEAVLSLRDGSRVSRNTLTTAINQAMPQLDDCSIWEQGLGVDVCGIVNTDGVDLLQLRSYPAPDVFFQAADNNTAVQSDIKGHSKHRSKGRGRKSRPYKHASSSHTFRATRSLLHATHNNHQETITTTTTATRTDTPHSHRPSRVVASADGARIDDGDQHNERRARPKRQNRRRKLIAPAAIIAASQWLARVFVDVGKFTDQNNALSKDAKKTMWEGKALAFFDAPIFAISLLFNIFNQPTPPPDPIPYLKQINETTIKTLNAVNDLRQQVSSIQATLKLIELDIKNIACDVAASKLVPETKRINALWTDYTDRGARSIVTLAQNTFRQFVDRGYDALANVSPEDVRYIRAWVNGVIGSPDGNTGVFEDLLNYHKVLMYGLTGTSVTFGAIYLCSVAAMNEYQSSIKPGQPLFDDRQYFNSLNLWLVDKLVIQSYGVQMLKEAYLYKAQQAVIDSAAQKRVTLAWGNFVDPTTFCALTVSASADSPLAAGATYCTARAEESQRIYDNMVEQMELLGQPLSTGDAPGVGLRLILGTDMTGVRAQIPRGLSSYTPQDLKSESTETRWLLPASLQEFDPRCTSGNVQTAWANGCAAIGTFRSCGTGCNLDPQREARWAELRQPLGYDAKYWDVAGAVPWTELRGMLQGNLINGSVGVAADMMSIMEAGDLARFVEPFTQMSDRVFWIVNATTAVLARDVAMTDELPKFVSWTIPKGFETIQWSKCKYGDGPFVFRPLDLGWPDSQCVAVSNPTPDVTSRGRLSGPTGVHCTSTDFHNLYSQACQQVTLAALFTFPLQCKSSIKPSLLEKHGAAALGVSPGGGPNVDGSIISKCYWDYYALTSADENVVKTWGGSCHLWRDDLTNRNPAARFKGLACEGKSHGLNEPYYQSTTVDCAKNFSYPWFPRMTWNGGSVINNLPDPKDSRSRPLFRLPVIDIRKLECSASPFYNSGAYRNGTLRTRRNFLNAPIACGNDLTRAIIRQLGPGYYLNSPGNSTAELSIAADYDTVSCDITWANPQIPGLTTTAVYITIREGPVYDDELYTYTGDPARPVWATAQFVVYDGTQSQASTVSLSQALPPSARAFPRVVGCFAEGVDPATGIPVKVYAQSKVVVAARQQWRDFVYPVPRRTCTTVGCITTVTGDIQAPGMLALGPAVDFPGYSLSDRVLYVTTRGPGGLWQVAPSEFFEEGDNVRDAVAAEDLSNTDVRGLQVTAAGLIFSTGEAGGGSTLEKLQLNAYATPIWRASYAGTSIANARTCVTSPAPFIPGQIRSSSIKFLYVSGGWLDPSTGDIYAVDCGCGYLYRITGATYPFSIFGNAQIERAADLGAAASLRLSVGGITNPVFTATDYTRDILYLAYGAQCGIMSLRLSTLATIGWVVPPKCGYSGDGGPASTAALSNDLRQITVSSDGDLYITDTGNHCVRKVDYANKIIVTVAGTGAAGYSGDNGDATKARLRAPRGILVVDQKWSSWFGLYTGVNAILYISDTGNNAVRKVLVGTKTDT